MKFIISSIINPRFIFFVISLFFITISLLGPPNVQIYHLLSSFDFTSLLSLYNANESFFRMPDTTNRFLVFILGIILLLISTNFLNKSHDNTDRLSSIVLILFSLFFISILISDTFYNLIAILLTLVSIYYFIFFAHIRLNNLEKVFLISYLSVFLLPFFHSQYIYTAISEIDNYTRFILVIPIYIMLREISISEKNVIYILNISGLVLGPIALFFFLTNDSVRVRGFTSTATIFANVSLLFSVLSILTLRYCEDTKINPLLPYAASLSSFLAWGLTGSRSSLFLFLTLFLLALFVKDIRKSFKILFNKKSFFFLLIASLIFFSSQSFQRFGSVYENIRSYSINKHTHTWKSDNTVTPRLIIWDGSTNIIRENPLLGVGLNNYNKALEKQILNNKIPPIRKDLKNVTAGLNHAHNQYLDIFAKTGFIGFLILIIFIIVNILFFLRYWFQDKNNIFSYFGIITITSYSGYMINHVVLSHQQSTLIMVLLLIFFSGLSSSYQNRKIKI